MPIAFGEKKKERIEEALKVEWSITTVEMGKRNRECYAHIVLKKTVELLDKLETIIAIDRGEHNLAVTVAISRRNLEKPMKGQFWRGRNQTCKRALRTYKKETSRKK